MLIYLSFTISLIACSQESYGGDKIADKYEILITLAEKGKQYIAATVLSMIKIGWPKQYHLVMGNAYFSKCDYENATNEYKEALEYDPNLAEAHAQLAKIYLVSGDKQQAFNECKIALMIEPNNAIYHYILAVILKAKGNLDESVRELKRTIDLNPDLAVPYHLLLADILKSKGNLDESIIELKKAVYLNPDFADPYYQMGEIYKEMDNLNEALDAYLQTITKGENNTYTYIYAYPPAIDITLRLGKKEQAIKLIKDYLELESDDNEMKILLQELTQ